MRERERKRDTERDRERQREFRDGEERESPLNVVVKDCNLDVFTLKIAFSVRAGF